VWRNRHEIVALASQTRAPRPGNVSREGGGTALPTQGGGMGFGGPLGFLRAVARVDAP
jgi:hypothetical protein